MMIKDLDTGKVIEVSLLKEISNNKPPLTDDLINEIRWAIEATTGDDDYSLGMRNGMRYVKYLIDGEEPKYENAKNKENK